MRGCAAPQDAEKVNEQVAFPPEQDLWPKIVYPLLERESIPTRAGTQAQIHARARVYMRPRVLDTPRPQQSRRRQANPFSLALPCAPVPSRPVPRGGTPPPS